MKATGIGQFLDYLAAQDQALDQLEDVALHRCSALHALHCNACNTVQSMQCRLMRLTCIACFACFALHCRPGEVGAMLQCCNTNRPIHN
jgi:hypothetical protein